jgi:hypothetical protein
MDRGGTEPADNHTFFYGNENADHHSETGFFVHKGITPVVKRVEFVSYRKTYIILTGHWCNILLNVHVPTTDKCDDTKDGIYEEI